MGKFDDLDENDIIKNDDVSPVENIEPKIEIKENLNTEKVIKKEVIKEPVIEKPIIKEPIIEEPIVNNIVEENIIAPIEEKPEKKIIKKTKITVSKDKKQEKIVKSEKIEIKEQKNDFPVFEVNTPKKITKQVNFNYNANASDRTMNLNLTKDQLSVSLIKTKQSINNISLDLIILNDLLRDQDSEFYAEYKNKQKALNSELNFFKQKERTLERMLRNKR